jgi:O-6-methylguanine DNA methyltransferase
MLNMQNHSYTIIETPVGLIVPIWITKPHFYLLRLYILNSSSAITNMFKELDKMGFITKDPNLQFSEDFNVKTLENLFNGYSLFSRSKHHHIEDLKKSLNLYFTAKINIEFPSDLLCFEKCSLFTCIVLHTLKNVQFGQVLTYGRLATLAGYPKAYRAVGSAMSKNQFPLIIPCHRIIRSNGNVGEFALGKDMKEYLLQHESQSPINFKV